MCNDIQLKTLGRRADTLESFFKILNFYHTLSKLTNDILAKCYIYLALKNIDALAFFSFCAIFKKVSSAVFKDFTQSLTTNNVFSFINKQNNVFFFTNKK